MAFKSAKEFLEALASGKKIRLKSWGKIHYIYLSGDEIFCSDGAISTGMIDVGTWENYELYQEDKSITLYQVFYRYKNCEHSETEMCESEKQWFIDNECSQSDLDFIHFVPITIPNEAFIK